MPQYRQMQAQTLIELLVTVGILSILTTIASPLIGGWLQKSRYINEVSQLHGALNFARGTAIQTRQMISLCAGDNVCSGTLDWQNKILVFVDRNQNGRLDKNDELLRSLEINPRFHWHWSNFRQQAYMSFRPGGMTHSLNGTFTLCDQSNAVWSLVVNIAGRTMTGRQINQNRCQVPE